MKRGLGGTGRIPIYVPGSEHAMIVHHGVNPMPKINPVHARRPYV